MTVYAAGLRVSEVVRLRITDIESDASRMLIRIHQGKGNKDRYSLLSERLLHELRAYWKIECPRPWLVPGSKAKQPMPSGTAQKSYNQARKRAGIEQGSGIHPLRHYPDPQVIWSTEIVCGCKLHTINRLCYGSMHMYAA